MILLHRMRTALKWLFRRRSVEAELQGELAQFLEASAANHMQMGIAPNDARRRARIELGGVEQIREKVRDVRPLAFLGVSGQDLSHGIRVLWKDRTYSFLTVLILTLGIGGATGMYSIAHGILVRPLPFGDPDELVTVYAANRFGERIRGSNLNPFLYEYAALASQDAFFDEVAFYLWKPAVMVEGTSPTRVDAYIVSSDFLATLEVQPLDGRVAPAPDGEGALFSAVVSREFWYRRFGGDPGLVGRTIRFEGFAVEVTGIMPSEFRFPTGRAPQGEVWITVGADLRAVPGGAPGTDADIVSVIARLPDGVGEPEAESALSVVAQSIEHPPEAQNINGGFETRDLYLVDPQERETAQARQPLLLFSGAVFAVFLVSILNVSSLTLARSVGREREVALRVALGASRLRVVRQLLTESFLLAGAGCTGAFVILVFAMDGIVSSFSGTLPRLAAVRLSPDVFVFGMVTALVSAASFGLAPALRLTKGNLSRTVAEGSPQFTETAGRRTRWSAILALELALALVLLVSAGLMLRSFMVLTSKPTGIDASNVLAVGVSPSLSPEPQEAFWQRRIAAIRAVPGVTHVAVANLQPLSGAQAYTTLTNSAGDSRAAIFGLVTEDYFDVFRVPILEGRRPLEDRAETMVNQTLARWLWPGEEPVGQILTNGGDSGPTSGGAYAVVGVIGDVRTYAMRDPEPEMYVASASATQRLFVRTDGNPEAVMPAIVEAVRALDPTVPVPTVARFEDLEASAFAQPRFRAALFGAFAFTALGLALSGVYGVASHMVARRSREFAVRSALGARAGQLIGLVLRQGAWPLLIGLAVGLGAGAAATRLLTSFLFEVTPTDPSAFLIAGGLLVASGILANLIPALRLMRLDPAARLRHD